MSSEHIYTDDTPVIELDAKNAFNGLTEDEKLYAHYLSKSSWFGSLIVLFQTSPESPLIFTLFRRLFKYQTVEELEQLAKNVAKFDDNEWRALLVYLSAFLANMGNYRGFGDSKFVPDLPKDKLETLVLNSQAYKTDSKELKFIWDEIKDLIFSLNDNQLALGFEPKGTTTYFSKNCTEDDSKLVKQFMELNKIEAYNTRTFKDTENNFEIRFASILTDSDEESKDFMKLKGSDQLNGSKFVLRRGDYSPILKIVNKYLKEAENKARNETEKRMIEEYIRHFFVGDLKYHKDGSRYWIKDKGPVVETYIGFIDTYRDPAGMRAEFAGFVSIVNKEMSKKFESLVSNAASFLPLLPWPNAFEKDRFLQPDFTSLDVLSFTGSGIPAGINYPNYDDIRQNEGFKNVSMGNVITAAYKEPKPIFLSESDAKMFEKYAVHTFEVQVGLHELFGHGSGKLFKVEDKKLNFDDQKTVNPLNGTIVDKWYKRGQTYDSVFTALASAYEECRAECVGLYLCLDPNVLKIFGFTGSEAENIIYVNWLSMVHKGIQSLQMYNPSIKKWLQTHSQARYVITRVLLEASKDLVNIEFIEKSPKDGKPDLLISFTDDQNLIQTKGKEAIGNFLLKLQVYKSMGDIESAQNMFDNYSEVTDDLEYPYLKYRNIVMDRKKPRRLFVQSSTKVSSEGKVIIETHPATHEGLIQSFCAHFAGEDIDKTLIDLYRKDSKHFI